MTAQPLRPAHLLTIDEYAELGEDENGHTELQEGSLVMSPSPTHRHMIAITNLILELAPQLPADLQLVTELDVDLQLAPRDKPGSARRPDLIVISQSAVDRLDAEGGLVRASEVLLVIEVISEGSRRTDHIIKHAEYTDAEIPHYWIIDLDDPASVVAYQLSGEFGYGAGRTVTGVFTTDEPFRASFDLARLRRRLPSPDPDRSQT